MKIASWARQRLADSSRRMQQDPPRTGSAGIDLGQYVTHNGSTVSGNGPVRITTPAACWAYAAEFPVGELKPVDGQTGLIRVELTVMDGAVGIGAMSQSGQDLLVEEQRTTADGNTAVELSLTDAGSVMVRNCRSGGVPSTLIIRGIVVSAGERPAVKLPEIRIDPAVFTPYKRWSGVVPTGYWADWLGVRSRADMWAFTPEYLAICNQERFEEPAYPTGSEQVLDWIPLLHAVETSSTVFVMAALGAGWGRWLTAGAFAAQQRGLEYHLLGVEAEPTHFQWLKRHFLENGLSPEDHTLIHGAAAAKSGECWFSVGNSKAWYGQSIQEASAPSDQRVQEANAETSEDQVSLERVRALDIAEVLDGFDKIDYLQLDIQGSEWDFLSSSPALLDDRVRVVNIGTHSREIEQNLRAQFATRGWRCLYDISLGTKVAVRFGGANLQIIQFGDGVQVWENPREWPR